MPRPIRVAVIGAGSAGQGLASFIALRGHEVALYSPPVGAEQFKPIAETKEIRVSGVVTGTAHFTKATTDIGDALEGTDVVFLTLRAYAHESVLETCLPHLKPGQLVVIVTGYWASLRLHKLLSQLDPRILIAETTLLPLASAAVGPNAVNISGVKSHVKLAALPAARTSEAVARVIDALPQMVAGENVLSTNLDNFNPIIHTPIALFNLGQLERDSSFEFYHEGITRRIAAVMDSMDRERLAIGQELGLPLATVTDSLRSWYGATGTGTYEVIRNCEAYVGYVLPNVFDYIREDVPHGLVPLATLGESLHVPCPALQGMITAWSMVDGVDYLQRGTTVSRLGLEGLSSAEVIDYVQTGLPPRTTTGTTWASGPLRHAPD